MAHAPDPADELQQHLHARKEAERALEAERAFASAVLDTAASLVVVLDAEGRIVRVNRACERATGYRAAELIGSLVFDLLIPADELPGVRETFRQLGAGQFPNRYENRWRMKDGSERTLAWENTAILGDDGAVRFVIATGTDVTDRRWGEARLRAIFEDAAVGIVEVEQQDRIVAANARFCELLGYPLEELLGKTIHELTAPEDREVARELNERGHRGDVRVFDYEKRYLRKDGSRIWVHVNVSVVQDDAGRFLRAIGTVEDVTVRRRAEGALRESEARFRSVFEQAAVGMGRVRFSDACWVDVNEAFCRMLGRTREEMLRTPWPEMTHPDDLDLDLVPFRRMAAGELESYSVEKRFIAADGRHVWARLTLSLVRDAAGQPDYEIAIIEDVTDRKRAEDQLRETAERLSATVQTIAEADRRKDEFLGMLSHELRNPLAPIRNSLFILDHAGPGSPQGQRAREVATRQVAHLTRLVDDLLDVTRVARGKIELRRADLDLAALARRTAEDYRTLMHDRGLDLALEVPGAPVVVHGDETRLAQVLGNLLSNAAKFTPAGGRVWLAVEAGTERAAVCVRDTGAGIPAEVLPTIFDPFTQAKQTLARSEGGLGLGLALVKGLVALHGGEVTASSPGAGQGTKFTVTLPLASSASRRGRGGGEGALFAAPRGRQRVLVVDDNRDAAESLAALVTLLGHDADVAFDAVSALGKTREALPQVVLCDIGLPGMDGYELARQLRARAGDRPVRLVAVSGYAQPEDVARAAEAGFDAHIAKPADPERIQEVLGPG